MLCNHYATHSKYDRHRHLTPKEYTKWIYSTLMFETGVDRNVFSDEVNDRISVDFGITIFHKRHRATFLEDMNCMNNKKHQKYLELQKTNLQTTLLRIELKK